MDNKVLSFEVGCKKEGVGPDILLLEYEIFFIYIRIHLVSLYTIGIRYLS